MRHECYFAAIAEQLRDWFTPREPFSEASTAVLQRIKRSNLPVSVHVRRGDYLKPGTVVFHGILSRFYRSAIVGIQAALDKQVDFFVFSDDPAAAEEGP